MTEQIDFTEELEGDVLAELIDLAAQTAASRLQPILVALTQENERITAELRNARRHLKRIETREAKLRKENAELRTRLAPAEEEVG